MKKGNAILTIAAIALSVGVANAAQTFELTGNDMMQYSVKAFEVKAGEPITLKFTNVGKLPKEVMGHNVVVLEQGADMAAFAMAAMDDSGNAYIPTEEDQASKAIAHTEILGPGESEEITFTLEEPGEYKYICSFPGHYAIMNGVITAK